MAKDISDNDINILIKLSQNGDIDAFEKIVLQYEKKVYNVALRMFKNTEDAKDISQEVFIKVYKNINRFDYKSSFSTWLYKITTNTCIDEFRKRKGKETYSIDNDVNEFEGNIKREFIDESQTPEQRYISKEMRAEILNSMNKLSQEHKIVIILRDIQGLSYNEISDIIDVSVGTVKSRISRARLQLKNILIQKMEQNKNKVVSNNMNGRRKR